MYLEFGVPGLHVALLLAAAELRTPEYQLLAGAPCSQKGRVRVGQTSLPLCLRFLAALRCPTEGTWGVEGRRSPLTGTLLHSLG